MPFDVIHDQDGDEAYRCMECDYVQYEHDYPCESCGAASGLTENEDTSDSETVDQDEVEKSATTEPTLFVPSLPDRPARTISFEQELMGDVGTLVSRLHSAGLTTSDRIWEYHSGRSGQEWLVMERDGTVAGELIYSTLNLSNLRDARKASDAAAIVSAAVGDGTVRLSGACGFHKHVALSWAENAPCFNMDNVRSLYHLWNYLEDTLFRLGSANYDRHRIEGEHGNYTPQTPKGLEGKTRIGRGVRGNRYALNLSPFLASMGGCRCNAFAYGAWEECTCTLSQPTVEFRVWNGTANRRKMRAYSALGLAIVAYAQAHEVSPEQFPTLEFSRTRAIQDPHHQVEAEKRLRFILRELPLTEREREDVRYCARNSSLQEVVSRIRRQKGYKALLATT